jgi:hypothetical protein
MSTQHTPGPWFNTSQDDTPMGEVMDQPLDSGVTLHISVSGPTAKADARLIAAAPDMFNVLLTILHVQRAYPGNLILDENSPLLEAARDAITKATGSAA